MKNIVLMIAMVVGVNAQASHMEHSYGKALAGISLENACITATEVRSVKGETACLEYGSRKVNAGEGETYTDYYCAKIGKKFVSNPRAFTTSVCTEYAQIGGKETGYLACVASKNVEGFLPATIAVTIVDDNGEARRERAGTYTIPACQ